MSAVDRNIYSLPSQPKTINSQGKATSAINHPAITCLTHFRLKEACFGRVEISALFIEIKNAARGRRTIVSTIAMVIIN
jgi:hypothetical protein